MLNIPRTTGLVAALMLSAAAFLPTTARAQFELVGVGSRIVEAGRPSILSTCRVVQVPGALANQPGTVLMSIEEAAKLALSETPDPLKVLAIDIGGTRVKFLIPGQTERVRFNSGHDLTGASAVERILAETKDWDYDVATIGFPGVVENSVIGAEPANLAEGWKDFDFAAAFGVPVAVVNDAAMQAVGTYQGGNTLFIGLGTGFGAALIRPSGEVVPLELGRYLRFSKDKSLEDRLGNAGLQRLQKRYGKKEGFKRWRQDVVAVAVELQQAVVADRVVIGGGAGKDLKPKWLPEGIEPGKNDYDAYEGGLRIWQDAVKAAQGDGE